MVVMFAVLLFGAIWNFILAYWIVTVLRILLTVAFAAIFKPPGPQELGLPHSQAPAYQMTLPYHPMLNLFWLPFAWMYFCCFTNETHRSEALKLGTFRVVICILIVLVGWILIPHRWAMTFQEFYIDYQPWITLIYLVIFSRRSSPQNETTKCPGTTCLTESWSSLHCPVGQ